MSRRISGVSENDIRTVMKEIERMPEAGGTQEQEWTLADLENVVYEFVNYNGKRPN